MRHSHAGIMLATLAMTGAALRPIDEELPERPRDTKRKAATETPRYVVTATPVAAKPQHKQTREMARRARQMARKAAESA